MSVIYTCDVAIVGGGIAGLAIARAASQAGYRVLLVEACSRLGARQSSHNHCWLHSGARFAVNNPGIAKALLTASATLRQDAQGLLEPTPVVYLATGEVAAAAYVAAWQCLGIPWSDWDVGQLADEPAFKGSGIRRALLTQDMVCSSHRLMGRILAQARGSGADIRTSARATKLLGDGQRIFGVQCADGDSEYRVEAQAVIVAAGAHTRQLLLASDLDLPQRSVALFKAHLAVVEQLTRRMYVCLDDWMQVTVPHAARGVSVLDSASDRPTDDPDDRTPESPVLDRIIEGAQRLMPGAEIKYRSGYACIKAECQPHGHVQKWAGMSTHEPAPGVLCCWPGKLSAYPLLAERALEWLWESGPMVAQDRWSDVAI